MRAVERNALLITSHLAPVKSLTTIQILWLGALCTWQVIVVIAKPSLNPNGAKFCLTKRIEPVRRESERRGGGVAACGSDRKEKD